MLFVSEVILIHWVLQSELILHFYVFSAYTLDEIEDKTKALRQSVNYKAGEDESSIEVSLTWSFALILLCLYHFGVPFFPSQYDLCGKSYSSCMF